MCRTKKDELNRKGKGRTSWRKGEHLALESELHYEDFDNCYFTKEKVLLLV